MEKVFSPETQVIGEIKKALEFAEKGKFGSAKIMLNAAKKTMQLYGLK